MATANFYVKPQDGWVKVAGDGVNNIGFVRITSYPYTRPFYVYASPTVTPTAADVGVIANCGSFIVNTAANTNVFWVRTVNPYLGSIKNDGSIRIDVEDSGIATTLSFNFTTSAYQSGSTTSSDVTTIPGWTFNRPSTGTSMNSAGQVVAFNRLRTNLLKQSQDLNGASSWVSAGGGGTTATTNAALAPDGTLTASKLLDTVTAGQHGRSQPVAGGNVAFTFSGYFKAAEYPWMTIDFTDQTTGDAAATFNISNGSIPIAAAAGGSWTSPSATITPVGNGWYRCTLTATKGAGTNIAPIIYLSNNGTNAPSFTGTGTSGIYVWGAQLETGSTATLPYIPTTTAAVTTGDPRITDLGFLPEEARTNLALQSQKFNTTPWTVAGATVNETAVLAPDGTLTGNKLAEDSGASSHQTAQNFTKAASALPYSYSFYAKQAERNWTMVTVYDGTSVFDRQWINLATGALGTHLTGGGGFTGFTVTTTALGNGWYKVTLNFTSNAVAALQFFHYPASADNVFSYQGIAGNGIYLWGAQLEQASFATSYIPTTTAAITRAADVAQVTGLTLPAAYTWFASGTLLGLTNSTSFPTIMSTNIDAGLYARRTDGGLGANIGTGYNAMVTTAAAGATVKWAFRAAANNANLAANGVIGTTATTYTPTTGTVTLNIGTTGSFYWNNYVKQIMLFPSAFTDAALQTLST